eukprot:1158302-Pelagomonas_calceolata.AAC.6
MHPYQHKNSLVSWAPVAIQGHHAHNCPVLCAPAHVLHSLLGKVHPAHRGSKDGVVLAQAHVVAWVVLGATLPDHDLAREDDLVVGELHAQVACTHLLELELVPGEEMQVRGAEGEQTTAAAAAAATTGEIIAI